MLLKYNAANVRFLVINEKMPKSKGIALRRHALKPGMNQVNDEFWKLIKKQENVKDLLRSKVLVEVAAADSEDEDIEEKAPTEDREIEKMVEETVDLALLESWLTEYADRPKVIRAINAQLDELKKQD